MKTQLNAIARILRSKLAGFFALFLVMGLSLALTPSVSLAQSGGGTPPANQTIGNQASATYVDNNGNSQTINSNTVNTTVQQIAAVDISGSTTQSASAGGQALFPHTLTNNGNGTDTLNVSYTQSGDFNFDNVSFYLDSDHNGVPDDYGQPLTNTSGDTNSDVDVGPVAAGASVDIVAVANIPTTAQNNDSETLTVTVTSSVDGSKNDSATDTATINDVVISGQKSFSSSSGQNGDTITVTLSLTNNGTDDATNLVVSDTLDTRFTAPSGGSNAKINGTALTDADNSGDDGYTYTTAASGQDSVHYEYGTLASGQTFTLTFDVKVQNASAGDVIDNQAFYKHDDITNPQGTNTVNFSIGQTYKVTAKDTAGTPNDGIIPQGPVNQGETVNFVNNFKNDGTTSDIFNITLSGQGNYPSGTTFTLYKSDPSGNPAGGLTDTDGDGTKDTGPVAAGDSVSVIVQVNLPSGASGNGPFNLTKTATSSNDPGSSDQLTDRLTKITANTVDVTNNSAYNSSTQAPGQGTPDGGEAGAVTTKTTDPGQTVTFDLYINNTSNIGDNYNLAAGTATPGTAGSFSSGGLPSGWTVQFKKASDNSVITNTGNITSGGNLKVKAVVTIPAGDSPGTTGIFFRALSPTSNAADVKHDAVTVNTVRKITLNSDDAATIAPGGTVLYNGITLKNAGNVTENDGTHSGLQVDLDNSITTANWQATVYYDANGNGSIDSPADTVVTSASNSSNPVDLPGNLAPGAEVNFIVKVTTSAGVNDGATNTSTLTVSDDGTAGSALNTPVNIKDITTVVAGNLVITKKQSDDGSSYSTTPIDADPGDTIYYQIKVSNNGSAEVTNVVVTDNTPSYTTMEVQPTTSGDGSPSVAGSTPANGSAGTVKVTAATLGAGESFTVTFAVQINN